VAVFTVVELILSRDFFIPLEGLLLIIGVGAGFGCLAGFIASLVAGYPRGPARGTTNSHTPAGHHR
jgi:hypothetical protein